MCCSFSGYSWTITYIFNVDAPFTNTSPGNAQFSIDVITRVRLSRRVYREGKIGDGLKLFCRIILHSSLITKQKFWHPPLWVRHFLERFFVSIIIFGSSMIVEYYHSLLLYGCWWLLNMLSYICMKYLLLHVNQPTINHGSWFYIYLCNYVINT